MLDLSGQREATAARLLKASAEHSYDPDIAIDWSAPPAPDRPYAPLPRLSLYGTPMWATLSDEQRIELSKHEVASIAATGIWFEMLLMQMLIRHVTDQDPRTGHVQYALTEVADECRHSVMFARMIEAFGTPAYGPGTTTRRLGRFLNTTAGGVQIFAAALIAEEILDALQREAMADESLQPLVRMVSRIHVVEETRHIRYAREELSRQLHGASRAARAYPQLIIGVAAQMVTHALINPRVYAAVGLDPAAARAQAWANPVFRETLRWAGSRCTGYFTELGLIAGPGTALWRRSALI